MTYGTMCGYGASLCSWHVYTDAAKYRLPLLSETSAMHTCGLGSLAGSFRIVFTANCTYYCYRLVGGPFIKWTINVTG